MILLLGMVELTLLPYQDHPATLTINLPLLIQKITFLTSRFYKLIARQSTKDTHASFWNLVYIIRQLYWTSQLYKHLINHLRCIRRFQLYTHRSKNKSKILVNKKVRCKKTTIKAQTITLNTGIFFNFFEKTTISWVLSKSMKLIQKPKTLLLF